MLNIYNGMIFSIFYGFSSLSEIRESNPPPRLGKIVCDSCKALFLTDLQLLCFYYSHICSQMSLRGIEM